MTCQATVFDVNITIGPLIRLPTIQVIVNNMCDMFTYIQIILMHDHWEQLMRCRRVQY